MCSLSRSTSTWPGITRSPVNSGTAILHQGNGRAGSMQARVHLDAARKMDVSVHLVLRSLHLQRDGVVDPIAHGRTRQRSVGNRRREGERRGIEFRQIHIKVD